MIHPRLIDRRPVKVAFPARAITLVLIASRRRRRWWNPFTWFRLGWDVTYAFEFRSVVEEIA